MSILSSPQHLVYFDDAAFQFFDNPNWDSAYSKIIIITDTHVNEHCLAFFLSIIPTKLALEIIEIEPGEAHKNIETCLSIWETMAEWQIDRNCLVINLGGGVVTDLGGFIASTYKRGLPFINVPTTLLAMVDASVGGKNGIDLGGFKNMIGTFNPPHAVFVFTHFLETLPQEQMQSGLAEMYKHGLIFDAHYWHKLQHLSAVNWEDLPQIIYESVAIKNHFVSHDFEEKNIRKALNFGHTIGHAIETYCLQNQTPMLHGQAIAIGMIAESYLSQKRNGLPENEFLQIKNCLQSIAPVFEINDTVIETLIAIMKNDKKNQNQQIKMSLLLQIGDVSTNHTISENEIKEALQLFLN